MTWPLHPRSQSPGASQTWQVMTQASCPEGPAEAEGKPLLRRWSPHAPCPPPRNHPHGPPPPPSSLPPGRSKEAEAAVAWVTGMKGTLKLNSVAEEEKSKLVPDEEVEAAPPPPLGFLSAMAAAHRPLHVFGQPVQHHWPETGHTGANTLPHLRTRAGIRAAGQRLLPSPGRRRQKYTWRRRLHARALACDMLCRGAGAAGSRREAGVTA